MTSLFSNSMKGDIGSLCPLLLTPMHKVMHDVAVCWFDSRYSCQGSTVLSIEEQYSLLNLRLVAEYIWCLGINNTCTCTYMHSHIWSHDDESLKRVQGLCNESFLVRSCSEKQQQNGAYTSTA